MVGVTFCNAERNGVKTLSNWVRGFDDFYSELNKLYSEGDKQVKAPCDVVESEKSFKFVMEIPGVKKEDIEVEFSANRLTIKAEKKSETFSEEASVRCKERSYGLIERVFTLPDGVDADNIVASFENGVLHLTLPKSEVIKTKKIQISDEAGAKI